MTPLQKLLIFLLSLFLISFVSITAGSPQLFFILFLILLDKTILSKYEILWYVGVELLTLPIMLAGIHFGPIYGFLTGFIVIKIFDIVRLALFPPVTQQLIPGIPTLGSLILGIVGLLAGIFANVNFLMLVLVLNIIKNVLFVIKEIVVGRVPYISANLINIPFNYILAKILLDYHVFALFGFNL